MSQSDANNVIGGTNGGNNNDDSSLTLPSNLEGLKCGVAGCDKLIDFTKLSRGQKQRVIKKAENGWSKAGDNKDTPCSVCVKKLKDDDIQCDKLVLKNGKSMRWVDGPRGHKVYKFEAPTDRMGAVLLIMPVKIPNRFKPPSRSIFYR